MGRKKRQAPERDSRAWALVRAQHGVIARRQLLELGFSRQEIEHRIGRGRLHRLMPGVYTTSLGPLTGHARWMAAVLSCGEATLLTHSSAAALWGLGREWAQSIEVATRSNSRRNRPGIRVRRRPSLRPGSIGERFGIPATTPVQTVIDLSVRHGRDTLEGMISDGARLGLFSPPSLRAALDEHPGDTGVAILRGIIDRRGFRLTRSQLERLFLPLAAEVGLPVPLTKRIVNGFEVDFYWPALRLVVETDGLTYHRSPAEQAQDRIRDQTHTAAGFTNLRFTDEQVRYERAYVRRRLAETVRSIRAR